MVQDGEKFQAEDRLRGYFINPFDRQGVVGVRQGQVLQERFDLWRFSVIELMSSGDSLGCQGWEKGRKHKIFPGFYMWSITISWEKKNNRFWRGVGWDKTEISFSHSMWEEPVKHKEGPVCLDLERDCGWRWRFETRVLYRRWLRSWRERRWCGWRRILTM